MKPIAIIGGGITGLTAAFRLQQKNVPVVLYEAGKRVGGVIQSVRHDGYLAESGPNSILETSPVIGSLIADLGLEDRRFYSDERAGKRFLVRGSKPVAMPSSFLGFLFTPLFSTSAKLRLGLEPFIRRTEPDKEESLADFVVRRLGREFLDYAINPFVAGVYAGDPAHLSVKHAFPKLHDLERRYGSLIKGQFLGARERKRRAEVSKQNAKKLSFDEGLQVLPDAIATRLGVSIRTNSPVTRLERQGEEWIVSARHEDSETQCSHSAVVYAAPPLHLPEICLGGRSIDYSPLSQIYYPPVATLVLGFRREDVAHPLDGFGMLVPEVEPFNILGTLFSSTLFPRRAPEGHVTLTTYLGGCRAPHLAETDPISRLNLVLHDLRILLGVRGEPTFVHYAQFRHAIPQYDVGYGRFKALMTEIEQNAPGLFFAGHYRDGIALSDSILSGHNVAARVSTFAHSRLNHVSVAA